MDGAIHDAGGPQILDECREVRRTSYPQGLPTGEAVLTTAGRLPARYVIHTVGPIYGQSPRHEAELLASCYRNSLALAVARELHTIAFPAISTGVYSYPRGEAAVVASREIRDFLAGDDSLLEVRLVFISLEDADVFLENQVFDMDQESDSRTVEEPREEAGRATRQWATGSCRDSGPVRRAGRGVGRAVGQEHRR